MSREIQEKRCPYCGSKYTISYEDAIWTKEGYIKHRKCLSCQQCYKETINENQ